MTGTTVGSGRIWSDVLRIEKEINLTQSPARNASRSDAGGRKVAKAKQKSDAADLSKQMILLLNPKTAGA